MQNTLLEKIRRGTPVIGTITHLKSPVAVEAFGAAGLDFVLLDMEHCPMDVEELLRGVAAADAAQIAPLVRVPEGTRSTVLRALDLGARGVIVPCVETVEQVKALVSCAKFPPFGAAGLLHDARRQMGI